jgi:hypothetical protein
MILKFKNLQCQYPMFQTLSIYHFFFFFLVKIPRMQPFVKIQNIGDPWLASGSKTYRVVMCYNPSMCLT